MGGTPSSMIMRNTSSSFTALKGGRPASSTYNTTPQDHTSARSS